MKVITRYQCEICGTEYPNAKQAQKCENQKQTPAAAEVGDIVLCKAGYGWFDGDERWISNPNVTRQPGHGNCFGECCTMMFYHVVTAIDTDERDAHRRRYHVATKAMSGKQGHYDGYTYDEGHIRPTKVESPPEFVVNDSKDLIGKKAKYLL